MRIRIVLVRLFCPLTGKGIPVVTVLLYHPLVGTEIRIAPRHLLVNVIVAAIVHQLHHQVGIGKPIGQSQQVLIVIEPRSRRLGTVIEIKTRTRIDSLPL